MIANPRKPSCLSVEGESRSDGSFFALPLAASAAVNFSPWTEAEVSFHGALITSPPSPAEFLCKSCHNFCYSYGVRERALYSLGSDIIVPIEIFRRFVEVLVRI